MVAAKVSIALEQVGTRQASSIQQQTRKVAAAVNAAPFQGGVTIVGVALSVGPVITVIHGLGRVPTGWYAVRRYAYVSGTIGEVEAAASTANTLSLGSTGQYTADIFIY